MMFEEFEGVEMFEELNPKHFKPALRSDSYRNRSVLASPPVKPETPILL